MWYFIISFPDCIQLFAGKSFVLLRFQAFESVRIHGNHFRKSDGKKEQHIYIEYYGIGFIPVRRFPLFFPP